MKSLEISKVPKTELRARLEKFRYTMDQSYPDWELSVIFSKINLYYFTGTMQEGMLFIPRSSEAVFWVRKSYERALKESLFSPIKAMNSFRDAQGSVNMSKGTIYAETEIITLALYERFQKYFPFSQVKSLDKQVAFVRSVKSPYELDLMKKSGNIHQKVLEECVPKILVEGMSEAELGTELFSILIEEGHHGVSRFGMFDTEVLIGTICFGESSMYPTYFNGPGGILGLSPAVPLMGSRSRKLNKGDLVFIDIGCGVEGYHTDKTMTYMFRDSLPREAIKAHNKCFSVQNEIANMLRPGILPSEIYSAIIDSLSPEFLENFMGYGKSAVKFLGHGVGLLIDETPVIAPGFSEPLQEGMVFAVEPKKAVEGVGMVGIENTFIVTTDGGQNITGDSPGLIFVK